MKLTGKIILMYMFAMALLTTCYGYSIVIREHERLKEERREEAESIALALETRLILKFQRWGHNGVKSLIRDFDKINGETSISWIDLSSHQKFPDLPASIEVRTILEQGNVHSVELLEYQHIYFKVYIDDTPVGCVKFSQPLGEVDLFTRGTIKQTVILILSMALCGGVFTLMGLRSVGGRLKKLIGKTNRIGQGDFSEPLQLHGKDELNQLATAMNEMSGKLAEQQETIKTESLARLAALEQVRHVDRLNTVGRLASGVAHELGTPLNVVSGRAELISSGRLDDEQCRESALAIKSEADRMTNIIRQLLDFARRRAPQRKPVYVHHIAVQCVELLRSLASKKNVELIVTGGESLTANADSSQLQQVLTNLVINAIQSMPDGGTVSIVLEQRPAQPPDVTNDSEALYCCISVRDEGVGISEDDRPHLFEPFFTTKDVGEGAGLGLSVSYGIVQDHEGWIDVQCEPGRGSRFSVFLPTG